MPDYSKGDGSILRPELTARPHRLLRLPVVRGYPVPWFVDWVDGQPEFRAMDHAKLIRAARDKLCWVCGDPLGRNMTFVAGPMCGINRVSAEPPGHHECGHWAACNCPFLARPEMERRETDLMSGMKPIPAAGLMIRRNPGVVMLWTTREYAFKVVDRAGATPGLLFMMGDPTKVEWYARGRAASRSEVEASIESGYPALMRACLDSDEAAMLGRMKGDFMRHVPTV